MARFRETVGLWLARLVLRATGNRVLANVSRVLPLIPARRLAISPEPLGPEPQCSILLSREPWLIWDPSGELGHPLSRRS